MALILLANYLNWPEYKFYDRVIQFFIEQITAASFLLTINKLILLFISGDWRREWVDVCRRQKNEVISQFINSIPVTASVLPLMHQKGQKVINSLEIIF